MRIRGLDIGNGFIKVFAAKGADITTDYLMEQVKKGEFYAASITQDSQEIKISEYSVVQKDSVHKRDLEDDEVNRGISDNFEHYPLLRVKVEDATNTVCHTVTNNGFSQLMQLTLDESGNGVFEEKYDTCKRAEEAAVKFEAHRDIQKVYCSYKRVECRRCDHPAFGEQTLECDEETIEKEVNCRFTKKVSKADLKDKSRAKHWSKYQFERQDCSHAWTQPVFLEERAQELSEHGELCKLKQATVQCENRDVMKAAMKKIMNGGGFGEDQHVGYQRNHNKADGSDQCDYNLLTDRTMWLH